MTELFLTDESDLALVGEDLALDGGLATSVLVSLFTDQRSDASPDGTVRGWWGEDPSDPWGSGLWLLARRRWSEETRTEIEAAASAALRWMIDDGIAAEVTVRASRDGADRIALEVRVRRGTASQWAHLWREVEDRSVVHDPFRVQLVAEAA